MARLALALALSFTLVCFFFAFSHATFPLDPALDDVVEKDLPGSASDSDSKVSNNIFLPSQKPDSDPDAIKTQTLVVSEQLQDDPKLTVISFRPINDRHFPRRPFPLTFRHGHGRRCGHHHHRLRRSDPIVRSYGNDMIMSDDVSSEPALRGGVRHQIPTRLTEFHRVEPSFEFGQDLTELPHHHHHHHDHGHHHHDHEDEAEHEEREHHHRHGGGFLRSFRKFLNHL
ncbi:uncharacterized protein LOC133778583 [Humulus lupulus]|uniref:uncharacterized protein LOC133778583 n=1 Tax=Humulus lupulus TaxID=3486 RepID=UPI002B404660|nr:uncharacterized protein LOC133778583 [Humulus lupulus]